MDLYGIVHYLHVVGAIGLGAIIALEWFVVIRLRSATTAEQARDWLSFTVLQQWAGPASLGLVLLAGLYMAATRWGGPGWIVVALIGLLLILPLGAMNGVPLRSVQKSLAQDTGPLSTELRQRLRNPRLRLSLHVRALLVLGIVLLMVLKPDLTVSVIVLVVAVVLALAASLPSFLRAR
jgi:hypothetical protein